MKSPFSATPNRALFDSRAAYYVGLASLKCWAAVELHRMDPDGPTVDYFDHCRGFLDGDAFAGLPPRAGGYDWRFFRDWAIAGGDPVADGSRLRK